MKRYIAEVAMLVLCSCWAAEKMNPALRIAGFARHPISGQRLFSTLFQHLRLETRDFTLVWTRRARPATTIPPPTPAPR
jgi:hypothetical protein